MPETCVCGRSGGDPFRAHGLDLLRCSCGITRQPTGMTPEALAEWYRTEYFHGVYYHTAEQDHHVARLRLDAYKIEPGARLLDVGCGRGEFVRAAVEAGIDAWGQDLAPASTSERVYAEPFEGVGFPTGSFDVLTMHDVLEHWPDPMAALREARRVLIDGGRLIVDFPRFHHESGLHHWKPVEHIWLLDDSQLCGLIERAGFRVQTVAHPVPSKTVVYAEQIPPERTKVVVPPGIGDGYWVATKLRAFCAARGITHPEVWIDSKTPRRSDGFWSRLPWVKLGGYVDVPDDASRRAYKTDAHPIQQDVAGCEWMVSLNGVLDHGKSMDDAVPGPTDWCLPLHRSMEEREAEADFRYGYKPYIVAGYWDKGFYSRAWLPQHKQRTILSSLLKIQAAGYDIMLSGAEWDRGGIMSWLKGQMPDAHDMVGQTGFGELLAMIRASAGVVGFAAGSTLMGPALMRPTVLLWGPNFPPAMRRNAVNPAAPYTPLPTSVAAQTVADAMLALL